MKFLLFINKTPWAVVILLCLLLGLAPFTPAPHLFEKLSMLYQGKLSSPVDIFDLLYHGSPFILLLLKIYFSLQETQQHD